MARPWMPLYVADYLADTGHLSAAEHGAYLLLIMHYWSNGSLPTDDKKLSRIARMTEKEWKSSRDTIAEFFSDGWIHARIERELADANAAYTRRANAGRKGGNATSEKRQCSSNAASNAPALVKQSQPQPQSEDTKQLSNSSPPRELDRIEAALREASGLQESPAPRLADLSPILGFMDAGVSLEQTILPVLRTKRGKCDRARSWDYFSDAIRESFDKRSAAAASAPPTPAPGDEIVRNGPIEMPAKNLERMLRRYGDDPESWNPIHGDPPPENPFLVKFAAERGIAIPDKHPDPRGPRLVKFIGEAAG